MRTERIFYVVPGTPPGSWLEWILLGGGIAALVLAPIAGGRWWHGSLRSRVRSHPSSPTPNPN